LVNSKYAGCVGGDWNCIAYVLDAPKNLNKKISNILTGRKIRVNNNNPDIKTTVFFEIVLKCFIEQNLSNLICLSGGKY